MSTPAEIIAARVNAEKRFDDNLSSLTNSATDFDDFPINVENENANGHSSNAVVPSISDETAFPALGGKKTRLVSEAPIWGPNISSTTSEGQAFTQLKSVVSNGNVKSSTIQEAFSLDVEDQLNVARPEFIKILTSVKSETNSNIECTTSHLTKKRTFLITGKPKEVRVAKRLIIKSLTKPVKISFTIPSKVRSRVLGHQGKVLKSIIKENDVKINVSQVETVDESIDDQDDVFAKTVKVTIEGDVESAKHAKSQILSIVKEETKSLPIKVTVDSEIIPFISFRIKDIIGKYPDLDFSIPEYDANEDSNDSFIRIVGSRESSLRAKDEIKKSLDNHADHLSVEEVNIPKLKQKFLPVEKVLQEFNVLIRIDDDNQDVVKFVGEKQSIPLAIESSRKTTTLFQVDVLDMAKAHKGNILHVSAVAALLNSNGTFASISKENSVSINVPSVEELSSSTLTSIPIEIFFEKNENKDAKNARRQIVSAVNKISPDSTRVIQDINEFFLDKVPETIDNVSKEEAISYVILGKTITLFSEQRDNEEDFGSTFNTEESFAKVDKALDELRNIESDIHVFVLDIPSALQEFISGPANTTLAMILQEGGSNQVVVKFHSNGEVFDYDKVFIQGLNSAALSVKKKIEETLEDAKEYQDKYKATVEVPSSILSRLIGKNGSNLTSLRNEFGVKIDVPDEESGSGTDIGRHSEVVICGIKKNCNGCKQRIQTLSARWADERLVRMKADPEYHRRLIGSNGVNINRLQSKYRVYIRFPSVDRTQSSYADAPQSKDEITIKGPSRGVAKAEEELNELYQYEKENGHKNVFQIPTKAIARVIGKAGETIKDISDGTGVDFKFKRDKEKEQNDDHGYAEIEITGSKTAIREAGQKIQDIINEVENFVTVSMNVDPKYRRDLVGPGGSVMKEIIRKAGGDVYSGLKYSRLLTIPNEGEDSNEVVSQGDREIVSKVMDQIKKMIKEKESEVIHDYDLIKEKHKLIVGPSGSIRHALQDEFSAYIEVPRPNNGSTVIKLRGQPDNISRLIEKLNDMTKDDWQRSIDIPEVYHAFVSERGSIFKMLKSELNVEIQHGNSARKAAKLSGSTIPNPPLEAQSSDETDFKLFTLPIDSSNIDENKVIPWRIKGESNNVDQALKIVTERLENAKKADLNGWIFVKNPSSLSKIVGPLGSNLSRIRSKTSSSVFVPRSSDKNSKFIYLIGSRDNLELARTLIEKSSK